MRPDAEQATRGRVRSGRRTKELVPRVRAGEIALLDHRDVDELAARALIERRVRAVLNADACTSGRYPNPGPRLLLDAGIPVVDNLGSAAFSILRDGDPVEVRGGRVIAADGTTLTGRRLSTGMLLRLAESPDLSGDLARFLANTLEHVQNEKDFFLSPLALPDLRTPFAGRHALIVVRGRRYKDDLHAISGYVRGVRPTLVGVDGGADALLEHGFTPDLIVGDMDSVSDRALRSGAELVVHAYPDGRCPGMRRLQALGLRGHALPAPGTSEDLALLLAHEAGAELLVAVGTHLGFLDFLEKGRPGMASTLLTRLKVGARLVDARGVSLLYRRPLSARHLGQLFLAALVPSAAGVLLFPPARNLFTLWIMHLRVTVGL